MDKHNQKEVERKARRRQEAEATMNAEAEAKMKAEAGPGAAGAAAAEGAGPGAAEGAAAERAGPGAAEGAAAAGPGAALGPQPAIPWRPSPWRRPGYCGPAPGPPRPVPAPPRNFPIGLRSGGHRVPCPSAPPRPSATPGPTSSGTPGGPTPIARVEDGPAAWRGDAWVCRDDNGDGAHVVIWSASSDAVTALPLTWSHCVANTWCLTNKCPPLSNTHMHATSARAMI